MLQYADMGVRWLKAELENKKIPHRILADELGKERSVVTKMLNGASDAPMFKIEHAAGIAKVLGTDALSVFIRMDFEFPCHSTDRFIKLLDEFDLEEREAILKFSGAYAETLKGLRV